MHDILQRETYRKNIQLKMQCIFWFLISEDTLHFQLEHTQGKLIISNIFSIHNTKIKLICLLELSFLP